MKVNEILALPMERESIKKIDRFIQAADKATIEYHQAVCYKALILNSLGKVNDALKPLIKEDGYDGMDDNAIVCYADTLKQIFLGIKRYDLALRYIQIKKEHLSLLATDEYYHDMIIYSKETENEADTRRFLKLYLEDDITPANRAFALEMVIEYHFKDNKVEEFKEAYLELTEYYSQTRNTAKQDYIDILKAQILINNDRLEEALSFVLDKLEGILENEIRFSFGVLLFKIYFLLGKDRQASIQDGRLSEDISSATEDDLRQYYNIEIKLYERMGISYNRDLAIKAIEELDAKVEPASKPHREPKRSKINEPIVIERVVETAPKEIETKDIEVRGLDDAYVSTYYHKLHDALNLLATSGDMIKLREVLRLTFIKARESIIFDEAVIMIKSKEGISGYHFKQGRLYDKLFSILSGLDKTIAYHAFDLNKVLVASDVSSLYYNLSPISYKVEEFNSVCAFPIIQNDEAYGSISFYGDRTMLENLNFEILSFLAGLMGIRLNALMLENKMRQSLDDLTYLMDNTCLGVKIDEDKQIKLNAQAQRLFGLEALNCTQNSLLELMEPKYRIDYQALIKSFLAGKKKAGTIQYQLLDGRFIEEELFLKELKDSYHVVSLVRDITDENKAMSSLKIKSERDKLTKLRSIDSLKEYLTALNETKKYSFTMIKANSFSVYRDVYGFKFSVDLIYAIGLKLKEILSKEKGEAFHFDSSSFIIVLENNDERIMKKRILSILDKLTKLLEELNYRVSLTFSAGICLVYKASRQVDFNTLLQNASLACDTIQAKGFDENKAMYYNADTIKDSLFSFQMELYISEAFDNNRLQLTYQQIVDIVKSRVYGYQARINLIESLVDKKYFDTLISKRHLEEKTDRYIVRQAIKELKDFYSQYEAYFKVFISLHKSSLANDDFLSFLATSYTVNKLPLKLFSVEIIDNGTYDISKALELFKNYGILLGSQSLETVIKNRLDLYFYSPNRFDENEAASINSLANSLGFKIILGISSREELEKAHSLGFELVRGKPLDKEYNIQNIIEMVHIDSEE